MLSFFLCLSILNGQSSYHFQRKFDPMFTLGASSLLITSIVLQQRVPALDQNTVLNLNRNQVNNFDRPATYYWNKDIAQVSDFLAVGSGLMYSYFLLQKKTRNESFKIGTVAMQSLLFSQVLSNGFKLSLRNRPYLYNENVSIEEKMKADARMSFFSAHTSTVSSLCFSFAFAYKTYLAKDQNAVALWTAAATVPLIEGVLRVKAGKHYPSDVITGYLCGLAGAYIMHKIHLRPKKKSSKRGL